MSQKDTSITLIENTFIREPYCVHCKQWTRNLTTHDCPIKHIVTVDGPLRGIVDRLYNLGIQPAEATYDLNYFDFNVYCVKIHIPLNQQLNCEVLGDLPAGWYYGWDEETDKICMLGYLDFECYVGARAKERVRAVARKFEKFLSKKDPAAVKAMLLLTGV